MRPVLCLRNDPDDNLGIAPACLEAAGLQLYRVDGFDPAVRLPAIEEIEAIIVFGGAMNVDEVERYPSLAAQRSLLRDALAIGRPILGICLGAQMLARAAGALVRRSPIRELGFVPISLTEHGRADPLVEAFAGDRLLFQWHEDTFDLPSGAVLLATGAAVRNQAFRLGDTAWGTQFHFEVDAAGVDAWLRVAADSLKRLWQTSRDEVRRGLTDHLDAQQRAARAAFAAFARRVRAAQSVSP